MNLFGDLTVLVISAAMTVLFWAVTRRLGRARRGATLMLCGLGLLTGAALLDALEHFALPGGVSGDPAAYALYALSFMVIGAGLLRWLPLLRRIDEDAERRRRAEGELQDALERARRFNAGMEQLARAHIEEGWDKARLAEEAVRTVARLAGAARVSLWRMEAGGAAITCEVQFDARTARHESGARIERAANPAYFQAIEAGRTVNVEDAHADPVTAAFGPGYLTPSGVGALLDAPILAGRRVNGVVCCEHVGGPRRWTAEEVSLLNAAAQYIAVADLADNAENLAAELRDALKAANAASAAKSAFLANMSHELRTPLNGVVGMAQALAADGLSPEQSDKADIIARSGLHLLAVLNDVLDLSRIEAGRLRLDPEPVDPGAVIADVCALFEASAEQKGLRLFCETAGLPETLETDPVRLRQIVSNLVANAVKFTDIGEVRVEASALETGAGPWRLEITVSDTGCGIAEDDQARLFARFSQADDSLSRKHGGAGLGLVIARELARAMDGDISLRSSPGEGACFTVHVHAGRVGTVASEPGGDAAAPLGGARVLVVDDNEVNRLVARCFLEPAGARVEEADSGAAAVKAFGETRFDLVLLDVHMPGLGGLETLERLRALPGGDTPVIAMTADALAGDQRRYRAAGMDGYVPKPVDRKRLVDTCAALLNGAPQQDRDARSA